MPFDTKGMDFGDFLFFDAKFCRSDSLTFYAMFLSLKKEKSSNFVAFKMYATCLGSPFTRCCKKCQIEFHACKLQLPGYIVPPPKSLTNFLSSRPSCIAPFFMSGCQKADQSWMGPGVTVGGLIGQLAPKKRQQNIYTTQNFCQNFVFTNIKKMYFWDFQNVS